MGIWKRLLGVLRGPRPGLSDARLLEPFAAPGTGDDDWPTTTIGSKQWRIIRTCPVARQLIEAGDHTDINNIVRLIADDLRQYSQVNPWQLTVSGYDSDSRELEHIPEVVRWCLALHKRRPYLPFLLVNSRWYILALLSGSTTLVGGSASTRRYSLDSGAFQTLFLEVLSSTPAFIEEYHLTGEHGSLVDAAGVENTLKVLGG